ncbi:threonine/serine ThrE exporter family protein [Gandjariella thermophila]|nr:threonine/serine exporter family protein [Gandjariella thermophila]
MTRPPTPYGTAYAPGRPIYGPEVPSESTVHLVLDLALRIGEVQMASGAGAADVTATVIAVTAAYGLRCEVDVIFTSISVCCHRGSHAAPVTSQRVVRARSLDYTRLSTVEALVRKITAGEVGAEDALAELERATNAPHPYPRWVATAAWAGMAAAVTFLLGSGPALGLVAAAITAVIDRLGRVLNRRAVPFFFQQVVGGLVATGAALGLSATGLLPDVQPSLVVAAGIVVLLSGLSVVSAVQDGITGYNVTAAGRTMEVTLASAGLVAGVALALRVGTQLGLHVTVPSDFVPLPITSLPVQVFAGAAATACFALASYAPLRALVVSAAAGAAGAGCYGVLLHVGAGGLVASAVAATLIGLSGALMSRRLRLAPLVVAVSGITPLLPGLTTYRAMYELTVVNNISGLSSLFLALGIALALAAGVVLGEFLAQPLRTGIGRLERKFAGPRMAGPLNPVAQRLD